MQFREEKLIQFYRNECLNEFLMSQMTVSFGAVSRPKVLVNALVERDENTLELEFHFLQSQLLNCCSCIEIILGCSVDSRLNEFREML